MEIEKALLVSAPRERVWALLLDPHVMTGAVPGMQSIDVISATEYKALMKVKVSFVSAKFTLHTRIVEQREPEYLRAEGSGEDKSVASSLKQTSEIFLTSTPEGGTELRIKVNVDVLGRLGSFGLSAMKTKADRMWEEFGKNLVARIDGDGSSVDKAVPDPQDVITAASSIGTAGLAVPTHSGSTAPSAVFAAPRPASLADDAVAHDEAQPQGWLARLLEGGRSTVSRLPRRSPAIRVEVRQIDRTVTIEWPIEAASQCQDWLRELLNPLR